MPPINVWISNEQLKELNNTIDPQNKLIRSRSGKIRMAISLGIEHIQQEQETNQMRDILKNHIGKIHKKQNKKTK